MNGKEMGGNGEEGEERRCLCRWGGRWKSRWEEIGNVDRDNGIGNGHRGEKGDGDGDGHRG